MSEHDWPGDDHGHDDHHDETPDLAEDTSLPEVESHLWEPGDDWHHEESDISETHHEAAVEEQHHDIAADPAKADDHDEPQLAVEHTEDVFPPALDVGALPEPVDGWPWIDSSSLGLTGIETRPLPEVDPAELAAYASEDLPPASDPWAALAGSDDPATAALAEFYRPGGPGADA